MPKNLVIVESPAKAKTIEKFLGKDFVVKSSFGHIRDLAKKDGIDVKDNFKPKYQISTDKKAVVRELKALSKKADFVWLASDEDREGEAIAWHLSEALKLDKAKTKRIVFNEITKSAITKAVKNPRSIDYNLVDAQQARRILDRLVGFEISPVLWRKIKGGLSAGRVQSVAVRLIIEREEKIKSFKSKSSYKVVAEFSTDNGEVFKSDLKNSFENKKDANDFLEDCSKAEFKIDSVQKKPAKKSPSAPFTTSTLQQEASNKLGFSVAQTMTTAQRLYEAGHITYMRTDSLNLSNEAMNFIKSEIENTFGEQYSKPRNFKTKSKSAQEAHEAIRPTHVENRELNLESGQSRLYKLIWNRAIASQMAEAKIDRTIVEISNSENKNSFVSKGEIVAFDGFLKVYSESGSMDKLLPDFKENEVLNYEKIEALQKFSKPMARYGEASLVKKLEELGIGRPSTYAPTISTIQRRNYIEKTDSEARTRDCENLILSSGNISENTISENYGTEKGKLHPTDIGIVVNKFLVENFENILDYNFTAEVENKFDTIAKGGLVWTEMISTFYKDFHPKIEYVMENAERESGERILGKDPKTDRIVRVRIGRFGPLAQIDAPEDSEEKPRFAGLLKTQHIDEITLEEALKLFEWPKKLGEFEKKEVLVAIGRFGPYVKYNSKFVSIPKTDDVNTINLERAVELIEAKIEADKNKFINEFENDGKKIEVLNGRFGPYIKFNKKNFKIPKDVEPKDLSLEDCLKLINNPVKVKRKVKKKPNNKKK